MGNVIPIVPICKALSCSDCARFVFNSAECDSSCGLCEVHAETHEIEIPDDDSTYSVEITGCCSTRKSDNK